MKFEYFIAKRLIRRSGGRFSSPIVRIATISVALGLTVMILAVSILSGFQKEIREKVIGFGSHVQIFAYDAGGGFDEKPINIDQPFYPGLDSVDGIRHIQVYATKPGIIKTADDIQGVVLKGIGPDFDWGFFSDKIVEGEQLHLSDSVINNDVLISRSLSKKLGIHLGDGLRMYFLTEGAAAPRGRKFYVAGIYETGMLEFDELMLFGDIAHIRKLNKWDKNQAGGFEVLIDDFDRLEEMDRLIYESVGFELNTRTIKQAYPQIFDWLSLQDMNVIIILALMILVAGISMISTLLIIILEKTSHIGILKAMGANNPGIRKIFIYHAVSIIGRGLIYGNIIGVGLAMLQYYFRIIRLPQDSYYVDRVPVNLLFSDVFLLNLGTIILCTLMLIVPSMVIGRISPIKAIRYE